MMFRYQGLVIPQLDYLYLLIPLAITLIWLMRKKFLKEELTRSRGKKILLFFTRLTFCAILLIAISNPYIEIKENIANITQLKILVDSSESMKLYNTKEVIDNFNNVDSTELSVDVDMLELKEYSSLGNSLLNHLAPDQNILFITDGQNNFGTDLEDVSLFAHSINSKIFGIQLVNYKDDGKIIINGPSKVVSGVENVFEVEVVEIGGIGRKDVRVLVDDKVVYSGIYTGKIELKQSFTSGNHLIKAELIAAGDDYFKENNVYYKTISVYDKPRILFVSKPFSPLLRLYSPFYDVETSNYVPYELDKYYAVILNNINAKDLDNPTIENLEEYVIDGNGLLVIGGKNSYDWGDYNTSILGNMLPVQVGQAQKKKDVINIVIIIDSGASGNEILTEGITYFDVQKTLTADIIKNLPFNNKLALIEGNYYLNIISGLGEIGPKRTQLIKDISLLKPQGFSELRFAYQRAHEMLRLSKGSKNIVIITDGKLVPADQTLTLTYVEQAYNDAIKTFIIGVGQNSDQAFLKAVKETGGGEYFETDETQRIRLYFGDPDQQQGEFKLFVYDSNHFITNDLKELGRIYGYNTVYAKSTARMLISSSKGDPILTIWNYGLGRVAALSTDDGSMWVPDLLQEQNSKLLVRTLNWLIEDPERKDKIMIDVPELRLGENSVITVKADKLPIINDLNFYEVSKGVYKSNYYPNSTGAVEFGNLRFGVNYKKEYLNTGINKDLERIFKISGGEMLENDLELLQERIKSLANVTTTKRISITWLFIFGAISIYLLDLFIRRVYELQINQ